MCITHIAIGGFQAETLPCIATGCRLAHSSHSNTMSSSDQLPSASGSRPSPAMISSPSMAANSAMSSSSSVRRHSAVSGTRLSRLLR